MYNNALSKCTGIPKLWYLRVLRAQDEYFHIDNINYN